MLNWTENNNKPDELTKIDNNGYVTRRRDQYYKKEYAHEKRLKKNAPSAITKVLIKLTSRNAKHEK